MTAAHLDPGRGFCMSSAHIGIQLPPIRALAKVVDALPSFTYRFTSEKELHDGIAEVLTECGIAFRHEVVAGPDDRFDFLIPGGIVIEAKVKGSMPPALLQCKRYAQRADVNAVILATSRSWGRAHGTRTIELSGKPLRIVHLKGAAF